MTSRAHHLLRISPEANLVGEASEDAERPLQHLQLSRFHFLALKYASESCVDRSSPSLPSLVVATTITYWQMTDHVEER